MTNKNPKHSPLPWDFAGPDKEDLVDSKKEFVIDGSGIFIYSGDREFILKAVNSFYPMLEALKNSLEDGDELRAMEKIKEAIKLAEKGIEN